MKLKSLILGSTAALFSSVAAQAADAIVIAEPEPVEYVRVCDVYGAGFFYIPGTETCLRIGGEIRAQYGTSDTGSHTPYYGNTDDRWTSHARARIYFDARSETEYGQLRGYVRLDTGRTDGATGSVTFPAGGPVAGTPYATADGTYLNHAWLSLGGFRTGWTDSAWVSTPQGGVAAGGSHSDSGFYYGYHQTHLIQYNFSGSNGFFGTVSIELDDSATAALAAVNYTPNFVGVVGVNQAWGAAWLKVGYDEDVFGAAVVPGTDGFGVTAGLHYNIPGAPGSSFRLLGFYADSRNTYSPAGSEWSIMASYFHRFNAQFGASLGVQYFNDFYAADAVTGTGNDGWALELNAVWTPVENFAVRTEIVYSDFDDGVAGNDDSSVSGFVRFSRFF